MKESGVGNRKGKTEKERGREGGREGQIRGAGEEGASFDNVLFVSI